MNRFEQFIQRLQQHAPEACMQDDAISCSYAQLLQEYESWQSRLDDLQVTAGSVIGLQTDYSVSATAAILALFAKRAIVALIPRDRELQKYARQASCETVAEFDTDGTYRWHPLAEPQVHPLIERLRTANDGGIVIFTSGSTGMPKAALHSVDGFLQKFDKPGRRFRTLAFLLLDHIAGLDTLFYTLSNGGTLILTRRRDPRSILELIASRRVEVLPTSPSFLRLLCAAGSDTQLDLSSLKIITYGSEPMDPSTLGKVNDRFPNAQISQKYGTTETGSPRTVSRGNDSLWLRITGDGVETRIVNDVLWIRSKGTILGYLNASSPVDAHGWYCTGDLVDVDGEWIRFRGRAADLINVGGEKVSPAEVEQAILELDFVSNAVVRGEPHSLMGNVVTARVAVTAAKSDTKQATQLIRSHCRARLPPHKIPVKIEIVDANLMTARQKAQRFYGTDS